MGYNGLLYALKSLVNSCDFVIRLTDEIKSVYTVICWYIIHTHSYNYCTVPKKKFNEIDRHIIKS